MADCNVNIRSYHWSCRITRLVQSFLDTCQSELNPANWLLPALILWCPRDVFPFLLITVWLCNVPPRLHATIAASTGSQWSTANTSFSFTFFCLIPSGRLTLLPVSFWLQLEYTVSNHIINKCIGRNKDDMMGFNNGPILISNAIKECSTVTLLSLFSQSLKDAVFHQLLNDKFWHRHNAHVDIFVLKFVFTFLNVFSSFSAMTLLVGSCDP